MTLSVRTGTGKYDIICERGALSRVGELINLSRKVLIVTDDGVPAQYAESVAKAFCEPHIVTLACGEGSKSIASFEMLCRTMLLHEFTRGDAVVAVGGGVVGDLAGFAASAYMRGVDFYNIPTTLLSQVDSSIGGKTAVNLAGVKNAVGAFYQPKRVIIDADTLNTLDERLFAEGLAESIKMACIFDEELFDFISACAENGTVHKNIDRIITESLKIKKAVVEADEKESSLRRTLNFGHTVGHAIESRLGWLHGECVAAGMLVFSSPEVKSRLVPLLEKAGLPTYADIPAEETEELVSHDKKAADDGIVCVCCDKVGTYAMRRYTAHEIAELAKKTFGKGAQI